MDTAVAKQPFKHHARIDLHWQRRSGSAPGNCIDIGAAIAAIAGADQAGMILSGQFERWKLRSLADLVGGDLVHRGTGANVALFAGRPHAAQPGGRAQRMNPAVIGRLVFQAAHHRHAVAKFFERAQNRRKCKACAFGRGSELIHDHAMRNIDESQAPDRFRRCQALSRQRGNHGIEQR